MEASSGEISPGGRRSHRRSAAITSLPPDLKSIIDQVYPEGIPAELAPPPKPVKMSTGKPKVPKPGPAKLSKNADFDEYLQQALQCKFLPEAPIKRLCETVKEYLMEGMIRFYT